MLVHVANTYHTHLLPGPTCIAFTCRTLPPTRTSSQARKVCGSPEFLDASTKPGDFRPLQETSEHKDFVRTPISGCDLDAMYCTSSWYPYHFAVCQSKLCQPRQCTALRPIETVCISWFSYKPPCSLPWSGRQPGLGLLEIGYPNCCAQKEFCLRGSSCTRQYNELRPKNLVSDAVAITMSLPFDLHLSPHDSLQTQQ